MELQPYREDSTARELARRSDVQSPLACPGYSGRGIVFTTFRYYRAATVNPLMLSKYSIPCTGSAAKVWHQLNYLLSKYRSLSGVLM